ncbi:hypothetical protein Tco_0752219 [Tanacetum coccineum]|uniref:Reverse transcriptase Ty1/copia-type domain-containing protein n=1 Tax=Tanacetum coccineum TaxID=301880 RepID=A0ABQ4Z673_9ASTR
MEDGIFFNQSKYIKEILKKFGLEDSEPMKTPVSSDTKLTKDEEYESVDSTKYRGMIGTLLYLTASRPDIMFSVCLCARFQEVPKTSHLEAVKRIFRYIKGTTHLGLWYPKGTDIETVVYADSDHAGDYMDRKSTSAEYASARKACQQALWMKQALIDYDIRLNDIGHISIEKVSSIDNITDILTNPLNVNRLTIYVLVGTHSINCSSFLLPPILFKQEVRSEVTSLFIAPPDLDSISCSTPCHDNLITSSEVTMPRITELDHQNTRNYIPIISNEFDQPLQNTLKLLEKRYFHEDRVVSHNFENMNSINAKFESIGFECLLKINEKIVPRFVLEFYSQLEFNYNSEGHFVIHFVIQNKSFSCTLEEFGHILGIPSKVHCSYSDKWSRDYLEISTPTKGQITRVRNKKTINVDDNEILNHEIQHHMSSWDEIILENAFCLGGHRDHANLPYGMLLTRLFTHIVSSFPELSNDHYILCDRVMHPIAPHYERKTQTNHGTKRCRSSNPSSSSNVLDHPSSSHHVDKNDEESFHSNTPSPSQLINS